MTSWAYRSRLVLALVVLAVVAWAPPGAAGQVHRGLVDAARGLMDLGAALAGEAFGGES